MEVLNEQEIAKFQSHLNAKNNQKQSDYKGFDALDPPFVGDGSHQEERERERERERRRERIKFRFSKQHAQKKNPRDVKG